MSMAITSRSAASACATPSQSYEKYERPWTMRTGVAPLLPSLLKWIETSPEWTRPLSNWGRTPFFSFGIHELPIGIGKPVAERNPRLPAERAHQGRIEKLARHAVGLAAIVDHRGAA